MGTAAPRIAAVTVRSLAGIRQRVALVVLAAILALGTGGKLPVLSPDAADNALEITVQIGGERLPLTCLGGGDTTILFLNSDTARSLAYWSAAQAGASAFARVCGLTMGTSSARTAGTGAATAMLPPELADRMAADLTGALAVLDVPAPYIIIATTDLEPVARRLVEQHASLVRGGVLIEPGGFPTTGWIIGKEGAPQALTLMSADQILDSIRGLV